MIVLGLTGSIGMGKSTTAALFRDMGVPVYDADAEVASAYAPGGAAAGPVERAFPGVTVDGAVDRARLSVRLLDQPAELARLEAIVHPIIAQRRAAFLDQARADGAPVAVLDIPLLFEVGADLEVDAVAVVSAPLEVQRERTLARPGMSAEKLDLILARQVPDAEKRARADFVIDTASGIEPAREQVRAVLDQLTAPGWSPRRRRP